MTLSPAYKSMSGVMCLFLSVIVVFSIELLISIPIIGAPGGTGNGYYSGISLASSGTSPIFSAARSTMRSGISWISAGRSSSRAIPASWELDSLRSFVRITA